MALPNPIEARVNNVMLRNVKEMSFSNNTKTRNITGYIIILSPRIDSSVVWMIISSIYVLRNGIS